MDFTAGFCGFYQQELARLFSQCTSMSPPLPDPTSNPPAVSLMPILGTLQQQIGVPGQLLGTVPSLQLPPSCALPIPSSQHGRPRLSSVDGNESDASWDTYSSSPSPSSISSGNPSSPLGSPTGIFSNAFAHPQLNPNPTEAAWLEFQGNGRDCELDELDKLSRRLNLERNVRSSARPPMSGRAADLLSGDVLLFNEEDPMVVKNRLIQLLREQERAKGKRKKTNKVCVFCRNNGEAEAIYSCHQLKDETGKITCPILYCYTCPKCGANKDNAHTLKYCPLSTGEVPGGINALKTARTSAGRKRFP